MSTRDQRNAQTIVFSLFLLGGYFLWRGRHRYEALDEKFEFNKSPSTRHMVALHQRVDREALESFLKEGEGSGGGGSGGGGGGGGGGGAGGGASTASGAAGSDGKPKLQ